MNKQEYCSFADLPIGAAFRLRFGSQPMRKLAPDRAGIIGRPVDVADGGYGQERCIRLPKLDVTEEQLRAAYYKPRAM